MSVELADEVVDRRAAQLTLPDTIGRFAEPAALSLFQSPLQVWAQEREDGSTHFGLDIDHPPLTGETLYHLLNETAPVKAVGNEAGGVLADWSLLEDAAHERSSGTTSTYYRHLESLHTRFGRAWQEFVGQSRLVFMAALEEYRPPYFRDAISASYVFIPEQNCAGISTTISKIVESRQPTISSLMSEAERMGLESAESVVMQGLRQALVGSNINRAARKKLSQTYDDYGLATNQFKAVSHAKQRTLARKVLKFAFAQAGEPEEYVQGSLDQYFYRYEDPEGKRYVVPHERLDVPLDRALETAERIQKGAFDVELITAPDGNGGFIRCIPPGGLRFARPTVGILPRLEWTRSSGGERDFKMHDTEKVESGNWNVYRDSCLGVLALAYFCREERASWPEIFGKSEDTKNGQVMRAAQVPVLALLPKFRNQLLRSDLISAAEAAVA